jgi:ADP-heptose:LPS heptosyltransferase
LVICNSSMAMHVAAAFRRPSVVVLGAHFASASQHQRQWGYPETSVLGRDDDHAGIFTVEETAAKIFETLLLC